MATCCVPGAPLCQGDGSHPKQPAVLSNPGFNLSNPQQSASVKYLFWKVERGNVLNEIFWWMHWELLVPQSWGNCIQAKIRLNMMQSVHVQFKWRRSEVYLLYFKIIRGLLHKETSLRFICSAKANSELCPLHTDEPFRWDEGFIPFHGGCVFWINDGINQAIKCYADFHLAWLGLVRHFTFCNLKLELSQLWLFLENAFREQMRVSLNVLLCIAKVQTEMMAVAFLLYFQCQGEISHLLDRHTAPGRTLQSPEMSTKTKTSLSLLLPVLDQRWIKCYILVINLVFQLVFTGIWKWNKCNECVAFLCFHCQSRRSCAGICPWPTPRSQCVVLAYYWKPLYKRRQTTDNYQALHAH